MGFPCAKQKNMSATKLQHLGQDHSYTHTKPTPTQLSFTPFEEKTDGEMMRASVNSFEL